MRNVIPVILSICLSCLCFSACAGSSAESEFVLNSADGGVTKDAGAGAGMEPSGTAASGTGFSSPALAEENAGNAVSLPQIVIHVCGAVERAGVYTLPAGSRVYEAVDAAGGFADGADTQSINQAQTLQDGMRLRIPTVEETARLMDAAGGNGAALPVLEGGQGTDVQDPASASPRRININTADEKTLCELNGIGPGTAGRIIAYREEHGAFSAIEDIMKVPGIKDKIFAKIKDDITV